MKKINENTLSECRSFENTCKEIIYCMYSANTVVYHFVCGENGFSEKEADKMIKDMIEFLPDGISKTKRRFYADYLFMAVLLAYQQNTYQDLEITEGIEDDQIGDIISHAGLGKDTGFSGIIRRSVVEGSFPDADHENGFIMAVAQIIEILEGRKYDRHLDKDLPESYFSTIAKTWPCTKRFIKCYYRFRDAYFKKRIRKDFQKNIEKIVKCYLISNGLSLFDDKHENSRKTAKAIIERAEMQIFDLA